jgi:hypothetical protein
MLEYPGATLQMIAVRTLSLHLTFVNSRPPESFRVGSLDGHLVYYSLHAVINAINLSILVGAVAFLIWRRGAALHWPLWGPWIGLWAFHALVYAEPRYMFPSRVGIGVMAAIMVAAAITRRSREQPIPSSAPVSRKSPARSIFLLETTV